MSTILITHDLGLAAAYCDRVVVMEKGRVVETAKSADIFANPQHPYTKQADARDAADRRVLARFVTGGGSGRGKARNRANASRRMTRPRSRCCQSKNL